MGEHEGGFRDVADAAGTDRDVAQDAPATHQQGEAAFVEGPEGVFVGAGQVVRTAGLNRGDPDRQAVGRITAWMLPPKSWRFPEYHRSMVRTQVLARQVAAHAKVLAAFSVPGGGLNGDGHRSARVWLTWQTQATRNAAGAKVAWMHSLAGRRQHAQPDQ